MAHAVEEALEEVAAPLGVDHLGVELHAVDGPLGVVEGGHRGVVTGGRGHEPRRDGGDGVGVAHPHLGVGRPVHEQRGTGGDGQGRPAVLAPTGARHLAGQLPGEQLGPVADAQDGDPGVIDGRVDRWRGRLVDGLRAAREDDPLRSVGQQVLGRGRVGHDLGVDVGLTDPAGDQLRVLGAEVDDQDRPVDQAVARPTGAGRGQWPMPTPCDRCRSLPSVWSAGAIMTSAFWNSLTVW